jgi:hypothetical protein
VLQLFGLLVEEVEHCKYDQGNGNCAKVSKEKWCKRVLIIKAFLFVPLTKQEVIDQCPVYTDDSCWRQQRRVVNLKILVLGLWKIAHGSLLMKNRLETPLSIKIPAGAILATLAMSPTSVVPKSVRSLLVAPYMGLYR